MNESAKQEVDAITEGRDEPVSEVVGVQWRILCKWDIYWLALFGNIQQFYIVCIIIL